MDRTYMLKHQANKGKLLTAIETIKAYRRTAKAIAAYQWRLFFADGRFNKNADIKHLLSCLSERYKQTCQYQVVGTLESFISNRQNDFVIIVHKSSLPDELKHKLFIINKHRLWQQRYPLSTIHINKIKGKNSYSVKPGVTIDEEVLKLSRKVLGHILSKHRTPSFNRINMALDSKVAVITQKKDGKAKIFDYWVRLSTTEKGNPVYIPIKSNGYYESIHGKRKNFCQVNLNRDEEISVSFVKEVPNSKNKYLPLTDKICVDIGLATAISTDRGDLLGKNFMHRLVYYDSRIAPLAANRQKQGLSVRSPRYDSRVRELRDYLKNEINRIFNRVMEIYKPAEIIVERLDFRNPNLSRRMNRLLSWFGKTYIIAKLKALEEEFGVSIKYENPAYSSQECSTCGYIDKDNRKSQTVFKCKLCNTTLHADVNAPRSLKKRSSFLIPIYASKSAVLYALTRKFITSLSDIERRFHLRHSSAASLLSTNPYYAGMLAQPEGSYGQ
jgi:putative transposase